jgi:hypothetical protein
LILYGWDTKCRQSQSPSDPGLTALHSTFSQQNETKDQNRARGQPLPDANITSWRFHKSIVIRNGLKKTTCVVLPLLKMNEKMNSSIKE